MARNKQKELNSVTRATDRAKLGDLLQELIDKYNALCAKLDADVGVTDTNYAATLGMTDINAR